MSRDDSLSFELFGDCRVETDEKQAEHTCGVIRDGIRLYCTERDDCVV